jgi:peroxiredoxin
MNYFILIFLLVANFVAAQHGAGLVPLEVGSDAPSFQAKNQDKELVKSADLLSEGSVVLIFYRGAWCPYCKKHISELQEGLQEIVNKGASVVIVTPEEPEYIEKMVSSTGATFSILYDEGYKIMEDYHVKYTINESDEMSFKSYVISHTKKHNGDDEAVLPVPATYIINKEGKVTFVHFETDYKQRSTLEIILDNLNN